MIDQLPPKHVMVVESDQNMAFALRFNLEACGYRVTAQADGLKAADQFK